MACILAVLDGVYERLRMLDANTYRKWLALHFDALQSHELKDIARGMSASKNNRVRRNVSSTASILYDDGDDRPITGELYVSELSGKEHLAARFDDRQAKIRNHIHKIIGADMGLRIHKDVARRSSRDELFEDETIERAFRSGVQLPVGKRSGTAFAELDVRFRIEIAALSECLHSLQSLLNSLSALYKDGSHSRACKIERAKQTRRTSADNHRASTINIG